MSEDVAVAPRSATTGEPAEARQPALFRYGRFYAPMALMALASIFVPLFQWPPEEVGDPVRMVPPMWQEDADASSVGILVILVLAVLLVVATLRPSRGFGLPLAIAIWTVLPIYMLVSKYGFSEPPPLMSPMGHLAFGMMLGLLLISVTHTIHAVVDRLSRA